MHVLVTGPESSGTRMVTAMLRRVGGVQVTHSSPAYRMLGLYPKYNPKEYDRVVLVVRNGAWNERSMVNRGRHRNGISTPRAQVALDLFDVLVAFRDHPDRVHVVTYESLVYETEQCIRSLCEALDVPPPVGYDEIQNGNEKFWSDQGWSGDDRNLHER